MENFDFLMLFGYVFQLDPNIGETILPVASELNPLCIYSCKNMIKGRLK